MRKRKGVQSGQQTNFAANGVCIAINVKKVEVIYLIRSTIFKF
jgi:hypothetical protein